MRKRFNQETEHSWPIGLHEMQPDHNLDNIKNSILIDIVS